ncbi:MAG: non-ribosomal peptide synthetase [Mycobacteriaceae bacterium]
MTTPISFNRPISATERLYFSTQKLAPPFAIQLVVEGIGHLDYESLLTAVSQASEACPGSRLVKQGNNWVDSGITPHLRVIEDAKIDFHSLNKNQILCQNFYHSPEATTEIILLRGATTTLLFRAFHGVMDAKGLGIWATDIFRILRGENPLGAKDSTADHTIVDSIGAPGKATRLLPKYPSPLGISKPLSGKEKFLWKHRTIKGVHTSAVAKIASVLGEVTECPTRLMVPVDLRRHNTDIRSTANLALPLFIDATPGQSWVEINAQILMSMIEKRELNEMNNGGLAKIPGPIVRAILRSVHSIGARTGKNLASAIISHAGQIDLKLFSTNNFQAQHIIALPVHTGLVPISFVILEYGDNTEITVSCRSGHEIANRLDSLLDRISAEFEQDNELKKVTTAIPTKIGPVPEKNAVELFRKYVVETPHALAISSPEGDFSYTEINKRASSVATALSKRGVKSGDIVAILSGRTVAGLVGQLGILFAGAAFLPLDPKHPTERISETLIDSQAKILITSRVLSRNFSIEELFIEEIPESDDHDEATISTSDTAFVTYTSGSTGRPKGVLVPHGGVVNFVASATDWYQLGPETRFAHYHTPAADMACAAFFSALLTGGCVTLIPEDISHIMLQRMLRDSGANTFLLTPSLLEVLIRIDNDIPKPRVVILGGEQLNPALAIKARNFFGPHTRILNSYGPTELSIVCTSFIIDTPEADATSIPIGTPAINTPVFLLNHNQAAVSPGDVGELYFGGPQVARGYLNRPELTSERFVQLSNGELTYRTGDLARLRKDGNLDFIGRVDQQVKIRGNRVEPGEVQVFLEKCDGISQAAVIGKKINEGEKSTILVAYIIADNALSDNMIRTFLSTYLPTYMLPTQFYRVPELPITSNGKLDYARLAKFTPNPIGEEDKFSTHSIEPPDPDDSVFDQIAIMWSKILNVDIEKLHSESDFFLLGGDSLASVEMLAQVSRSIIGQSHESLFIEQLEDLLKNLTLDRVYTAVTIALRGSA